MNIGETVRFSNPLTPDEAAERFTVLEIRGDRVLVEFICSMHLLPTFVYLLSDLEPVTRNTGA